MKKLLTIGPIILLLIAIFAYGLHQKSTARIAAQAHNPLSHQVVFYQESLVKKIRPAPALAALQYAYVTSAYADGLASSGNQMTALKAAADLLHLFYPSENIAIDQQVAKLIMTNHLRTKADDPSLQTIVLNYQQRFAHDGHDLVWDGVVLKGPGKWLKLTTKDPFTPRAGDWQRWNVKQAIVVPAPPVYGGAEDQQQIAIVKQAVATRNGQDINIINFWGGTPGSETPAGIWQNQLYKTVQPELPSTVLDADQRYAAIQKDLAQTLSDAFMECWKVKYQYWTARPSMRIPGLVTAMNDPNFPGYISGHSTISKAAADVLTVLVPKHRSDWQAMALEARQSRLKAGIHFDVDNAVGFSVGSEVARQTNAQLRLQSILN